MVNTSLSIYHTSYSYQPIKKVTDTLYDNSGKLNNFYASLSHTRKSPLRVFKLSGTKRILLQLVAQLCLTLCDPWTVARQAPLSMEFSRQENWHGQLFPSPGDLPNSGIEPEAPAVQADSLLDEPPGKDLNPTDKGIFWLPKISRDF